MTMNLYKIDTESGTVYVSADLAEASSPFWIYFGSNPLYDREEDGRETSDDEGYSWQHSPYQTADAQHREIKMADILAEHYDLGEVLTIDSIE